MYQSILKEEEADYMAYQMEYVESLGEVKKPRIQAHEPGKISHSG